MDRTPSESYERLEALNSLIPPGDEHPAITASCILESLPTPVVALSGAGDIIVFNQAAADLFEVEPRNAVGQSVGEVFSTVCAHTLRKIARRSAEFCVVSQATLTHAGRDYTALAAPLGHEGVVDGAVVVIGPSAPSAPARDLSPVRTPDGAGYWVPIFVPTQDKISGTPFSFR